MFHLYQRYVLRRVAGVFLSSLVIFTVLLVVFSALQMFKRVTLGFHPIVFLKMLWALNSFLLAFSIPMSMLIATLLVYGRMASDREVMALRASGVGPAGIAVPALLLAAGISVAALGVMGELYPRGHFSREALKLEAFDPSALFEPGRALNLFEGFTIFAREREGDILRGLKISQADAEGRTADIEARWAEIVDRKEQGLVRLIMHDTQGAVPTTEEGKRIVIRQSARLEQVDFDIGRLIRRAEWTKDKDDLTLRELRVRWKISALSGKPSSVYAVELHKRLVLATSCFAFASVGIPLGIRLRRGERSVSTALGLAVAVVYYGLMLVIEKFGRASWEVLSLWLWGLNVALVIFGAILYWRITMGRARA